MHSEIEKKGETGILDARRFYFCEVAETGVSG